MLRKILSWDCANKSLAWSFVEIDTELFAHVHSYINIPERELGADDRARAFRYISYGVVDFLPGQLVSQVGEVERTQKLRAWLDQSEVAVALLEPHVEVLIEQQPTFNSKSSMVQHQLVMYYSNFHISVVNSRLKNNNTLCDYDAILRQEMAHKQKKNAVYSARKKHSVACLNEFLSQMQIKITSIPRKNMDDLADSTLQIFAYYALTA